MDGAIIKTPLSDEPRYVPSILDTQYWGCLLYTSASGVHAIYAQSRLYLCVAMQPKPEALSAQKLADKKAAAGHFDVDENWSAAEVNARWGKRAVLTDENGRVLDGAVLGARGMTDVGAREVFFEFNALDHYPETMYLAVGDARVRVR